MLEEEGDGEEKQKGKGDVLVASRLSGEDCSVQSWEKED